MHPAHLKKEKLFTLDRIILVAFILGSVFLEGSFEFRIVGLLLIYSFLVLYQKSRLSRNWPFFDNPPEITAFTLWTIWALATMPLISEFPALIPIRYQVQLQVIVIYWVLYGSMRLKFNMNFVFLSIFIAGAIQGMMAYSGYTQIVGDNINIDITTIRLRGFARATNSNALGLLMTRATLSGLFLWRHPRVEQKKLFRIAIICFLVLAGYIIIISGSRKASLYFAISLFGWWSWALPKSHGIKGILTKLLFVCVGFLILNLVIPNVLETTAVGRRWSDLINRGDGTIKGTLEEDGRIHMARWGVQLFQRNPVAGIGLGHYMMYNDRRMMSHNDYIETLSGTGIIGFLIYQSMKFFLGIRLFKLLLYTKESRQSYLVKMMILMWIYIVLAGAGFHQYHDYQTMILFAALFTYSWLWEKDLKKSYRYPHPVY